MLSRRVRLLAVAVLALPAIAAGAIAAQATPTTSAPVQPAPTVDYTDPTKGAHLRLGLRVSKGGVAPTLLEIDRGFTSTLRGSTGPFELRLRDSAGALLDTLTFDDPLAVRAYDSKQNVHSNPRVEEADIVVDLPLIDTTVTVEVVLERGRIGEVEVGSLIQACQGRPLPCAFS
ncbi:hypothetical protein DFJ67_4628 [Asanoa ferruginea]|uniref:Glycosyl hydrolase family 98 putative carbohydrate-binding module domain-containing protein n=1 Tax=Asanoa ferruginea TaxID=53367 RepID=A0A3D9ZXS9_9ACTN|nr:hypothetical protein [Asanoa ferruginea]REF98610.1 hypothetical protein DFJ67_4628 [Asanoa ferruginea]GIF50623.1 hypothetical protein Afe04nite_51620 [Asanoa ferruginea]